MVATIVLPLDGSAESERALPYATAAARSTNARLVLLNVTERIARRDEAAATGKYGRQLDQLAAELAGSGVAVEARFERAPTADIAGSIVDATETSGAALIVMATQGRTGASRWLYGSVADAVLRRASVPVLLVPPGVERAWPAEFPPRVLVTLDGTPFSETAIGAIKSALAGAPVRLLLLRVLEGPTYADIDRLAFDNVNPAVWRSEAEAYLDQTATGLREAGFPVETRVEVGDPTSVIARVAEAEDVDVVALATHGRSGFGRAVLGSVATGLLRRLALPLLLVRPTADQVADAATPVETLTPETVALDRSEIELLLAGLQLVPDSVGRDEATVEAVARIREKLAVYLTEEPADKVAAGAAR